MQSFVSPKSRRWPSPRRRVQIRSMPVFLFIVAAASVRAQTAVSSPWTPDAWGETPPSWLNGASVSAKAGYDTNIFGVSANLAGHPAIANISSWFTTLSANLTFDLLAASGAQNGDFLKTLTVAYAADYTAYGADAREDNLRNTVTLAVK